MAGMPDATQPVYLRVGDIWNEIGTVDIPMTMLTTSADKPSSSGARSVEFTLRADMPGFRANLAELLRAVADELENPAQAAE